MIAIMSKSVAEELSKFAVRLHSMTPGEVLFRAGDPVLSLFVVISGAVQLTRSLPHGTQLTLQRAGRGAILAEASLFSERYHCEAAAVEPSVLSVVPRQRIEAALLTEPGLARIWTRHLAQEVQRTRNRAEILSLRSVAAKVDTWMALEGGALPPKGQWRQLAAEISVTPEALYRELARRRAAFSNTARPSQIS
jgi:CRP-like cAMP-binding protein